MSLLQLAADIAGKLTPGQWGAMAAAAFLSGFSKCGVAGAGIMMTPLLAMAFSAGQTLGILLPLLCVGDVFALLYHRRQAVWSHVARALPWAAVGIVGGWGMARAAITFLGPGSDIFLRKFIGAMMLLMVLMGLYLRRRPNLTLVKSDGNDSDAKARPWFVASTGLLGGVATMLTNNAGPIWNMYFLALRLPVRAFLGSSAWLFFILNLSKVPFSVQLGFINGDTLLLNAILAPMVVVGAVLGVAVARRISQRVFEMLAESLALAASVYLLF